MLVDTSTKPAVPPQGNRHVPAQVDQRHHLCPTHPPHPLFPKLFLRVHTPVHLAAPIYSGAESRYLPASTFFVAEERPAPTLPPYLLYFCQSSSKNLQKRGTKKTREPLHRSPARNTIVPTKGACRSPPPLLPTMLLPVGEHRSLPPL